MHEEGDINLLTQILKKMRNINPWHYVWIIILAAESFTFILNSLQSFARWGYISMELIEIGTVDAFIVSVIVTPAVIYSLKSANDRLRREITDRKKAEEELIQYRGHLEELVAQRTKELSVLHDQLRQSQKMEAVGLLAGGIAHDFSNILTTIKGSMYLMQKKLKENMPLIKYTEQILTSINKANSLAHSLLAFSRKQTITLQPLDLNEIIIKASKFLSQLIGEHIELITALTDKKAAVMVDINQMEQVLVNLAANARDAMPDGGRLTIETDIIEMDEGFKSAHGYGGPGKYILMTVADTGTGMEDEIREKIFEPFFTTKELGKGSGLGLAVTYGIVKQHNGFIDVETALQKGTTFKIYIPTVEAKVIQPESREVPSAKGGAATILLAEDDSDTRDTISEILRLAGYSVLEARDGEDAVKVFMKNNERIDLMVLDVRMPKKNGRQVYEEIRKASPGSKFLFMSGYTEDIISSREFSEGEFNFISKAASPDEFLARIREVLDNVK